jgi:hypothetical protein
MRLFLSHRGLGENPNTLPELANYARDAVIIGNALDYDTAQDKQNVLEACSDGFRERGISTTEIDLRHPGARQALGASAARAEIYWVEDGRATKDLRNLMSQPQTGLYGMLSLLLERDEIVYAGSGHAGALVAADIVKTDPRMSHQTSDRLLAAIKKFETSNHYMSLVIKDNLIFKVKAPR